MDNKGKLFVIVAIVVILALCVGVYLYKESPNHDYDPPKTPGSSVSSSIPPRDSDSSGNGTTSQNSDDKSPTVKPKKIAYPTGVTPVQKVTANMKGQDVTVMGYAVKMTKGKGHHFYTFRDMIEPGSIKAVVFKAESDNKAVDVPLKNSLNTGSLVTLSGRVDVYNNELEIIVNEASE